ncbi:glycine cleavage system H protein [Cryobacterium mesophilum]|uniref:Glycine cleavage system H protein n=1 Tax=Terrimesophilobacter mesophilus TaxID=433647 RepID=A0A4R8VB84_9MICO|nr:glycine cleavage system protein GcvH [Terrimesophilobacter mesophilus]MBB5633815.1 glycine cleavage system H protein [Terrimesophilobacter mesophilus]TFB80494.1 glycine cleavage system protein GcvH [Terrimesophilobacter mesophilus]
MPNYTGSADKADRKYTSEHEWLDISGTSATIGITDYAADKLGDVVFVELPKVGSTVQSGKVVGEIESTKSVGELFAPVDGTVTAANTEVVDSPQLVNEDPFGAGWMITVEVADASVFDAADLMDFDAYTALVGE